MRSGCRSDDRAVRSISMLSVSDNFHIGANASISRKLAGLAMMVAVLGAIPLSAQPARNAGGAPPSSVERQLHSVERMKAPLAAQGRFMMPHDRARNDSDSFFNSHAIARLAPVPVHWNCDAVPEGDLSTITAEAAQANDIPAELLRSVIRQESASHACAVSSKGAMGLMQLMPATAATLGVKNAFDPQENVAGGARFLRQLINMFNGDLPMALGAYNAGPNNQRLLMGLPLPGETTNYVDRVLAVYRGE